MNFNFQFYLCNAIYIADITHILFIFCLSTMIVNHHTIIYIENKSIVVKYKLQSILS